MTLYLCHHLQYKRRYIRYNTFDSLAAPGNGTPTGGLLTGYRMYRISGNVDSDFNLADRFSIVKLKFTITYKIYH